MIVDLLIGPFAPRAQGKYVTLILAGRTLLTGLLMPSGRGRSVQVSCNPLGIIIGKERADAHLSFYFNSVFVKLCIFESLKGPPNALAVDFLSL